jgi:uncharacterized membrane protein
MGDEIIYALVFLLLGLVSILSYRNSETDKKDPYQIKSTFLILGILSILCSIYLLVKSF